MQKAHDDLNVVQCCVGDETLGHLLPHLLEQLEVCQKSLTGFVVVSAFWNQPPKAQIPLCRLSATSATNP